MDTLLRMAALLVKMERSPGTLHYYAIVFNTSPRSIQRDIQHLKRLGFSFTTNPDTEVISLISNFGVPHLDLNQLEVFSMLVLFSEFGNQIREPLFVSLQHAATKLATTFSGEIVEMINKVRHSVRLLPSPTNIYTDYEEIYEVILHAIQEESIIYIHYNSTTESEIQTFVYPFLTFFNRSWYLIGYSSLHQEPRTFKISRIASIKYLNKKFSMPVNFTLDHYFRNAWRMIPGDQDYDVVVRFSPKVSQNVAELRWHKTQEARWLDTGEVELRFTVSGLSEIIWWILGYGSEATVIQPPELCEMVQNHARQILDRYNNLS